MIYTLSKFLGVFNIFFLVSITLYFTKSSKTIDFQKKELSFVGADTYLGRFFNLSLFIFSLLQVIFAISVCKAIGNNNSQTTFLFFLGGMLLCLASLITTVKLPFHQILVVCSTICVTLGVILLSIDLLPNHYSVGIISLISSLFIPISFLSRPKLPGIYWELLLFTVIAIWNITLSIPLF